MFSKKPKAYSVYLFFRFCFSLLLSMCLRFVPRFTGQIKKVAQAQQCIGRNVNNGKVWARAAHGPAWR